MDELQAFFDEAIALALKHGGLLDERQVEMGDPTKEPSWYESEFGWTGQPYRPTQVFYRQFEKGAEEMVAARYGAFVVISEAYVKKLFDGYRPDFDFDRVTALENEIYMFSGKIFESIPISYSVPA